MTTHHDSQASSLDSVSVGHPITRQGVSLFPLYLHGSPLPAILTGEDSGLVVEELERAEVPTLSARNPRSTPILIVEGQHLVGGKQNRTVNASILIGGRTNLEIPVSCLEQGRWGRRRAYASEPAFAPRRVRMRKELSVNASMQAVGSRSGDQGAVWREVDDVLRDARTESATSAAADVENVYQRDRDRASAVEELTGLRPMPEQCGIAVGHGSSVVAIELFGAPDLLAAHWGALIRSYMVEQVRSVGRPSATNVLSMIRRFIWTHAQTTPGVGLGSERRVKDRDFVGQALTLDDSVVHASIFRRSRERRRTPRPPHPWGSGY